MNSNNILKYSKIYLTNDIICAIILSKGEIKMNRKKEIIVSTVMFLLLLISEILIGKYAGGWIRYSFGDVLVMPAMYFLVRIFTSQFKRTLPLILFVFACFVELLQHFDICGVLGIPEGSILRVIIGTTGLWSDVWCYAAGTGLIYILIYILIYLGSSEFTLQRN